jgi:Zn finger protein HypA/HybF involved in hydrogenase expression
MLMGESITAPRISQQNIENDEQTISETEEEKCLCPACSSSILKKQDRPCNFETCPTCGNLMIKSI